MLRDDPVDEHAGVVERRLDRVHGKATPRARIVALVVHTVVLMVQTPKKGIYGLAHR